MAPTDDSYRVLFGPVTTPAKTTLPEPYLTIAPRAIPGGLDFSGIGGPWT